MNNDLKLIKSKFGEKMSHFCRSNFSTILEAEGLLSDILLFSFHPNRDLLKDIEKSNLQKKFIKHINSFLKSPENLDKTCKSPFELMKEAGYYLYHCKTKEEVKQFENFYEENEKLCTFKDDRTIDHLVFFAVKMNIDEIKREDFIKPHRQDAYGTSVISIQFEKDNDISSLSIKNRYNHTVSNPDATFKNNLEKIRKGLTKSFEEYYNLSLEDPQYDFEMDNYVIAKGKFYKFYMEVNNTYYCFDNIIIHDGKVLKLEKEKYILADDSILNLKNKQFYDYNKFNSLYKEKLIKAENTLNSSFIPKDKKITKRIILFQTDNKTITLKLNEKFQIVGLEDFKNIPYSKVKEIKNSKGRIIKSIIEINNLRIGRLSTILALDENNNLTNISNYYKGCIKSEIGFVLDEKGKKHPTLNIHDTKIDIKGNNIIISQREKQDIIIVLDNNQIIEYYDSNVKELNCGYFQNNVSLKKLITPNVLFISQNVLKNNQEMEEINLPEVQRIGKYFLYKNTKIIKMYFPKLTHVSDYCCPNASNDIEMYIPNLETVGQNTFCSVELEKEKVRTLIRKK